jgi:tripartite-type tricarboxylate transporter receptor subunit TctC
MRARTPFVVFAVLAAFIGSAGAGEWPDKPVRIIFPYAAGSTGDATARLIARHLSDVFGQPFIVENRVGANGVIGTEAVARAAPDGYTLLWAVTPQIAIAPVMAKVPYDPAADFVPISAVSTNRFALLVNAVDPVGNSPAEFSAMISADIELWARAVKIAGLQAK